MALPIFTRTGFAVLTLTTAWVSLALCLGAILQPTTESDAAPASQPWDRPSWTYDLEVSGHNPCTDEQVTVAATLAVDAVASEEPGPERTDVTARLTNGPSMRLATSIEPRTDRFAPYTVVIRGAPYAHTLRTSLDGPHAGLDLVVDLRGRVNDRGDVTFRPDSVRIVPRHAFCDGPPA